MNNIVQRIYTTRDTSGLSYSYSAISHCDVKILVYSAQTAWKIPCDEIVEMHCRLSHVDFVVGECLIQPVFLELNCMYTMHKCIHLSIYCMYRKGQGIPPWSLGAVLRRRPKTYKVHIFLSILFNFLAVFALVFVLWPLTGNPIECLIPAYDPISLFILMLALICESNLESMSISESSLVMDIVCCSVSWCIRMSG